MEPAADLIAHHVCSPVLKRGLCDEELCKAALSCHFALDLLTVGNLQVARVRSWNGARSSVVTRGNIRGNSELVHSFSRVQVCTGRVIVFFRVVSTGPKLTVVSIIT